MDYEMSIFVYLNSFGMKLNKFCFSLNFSNEVS